MEKKCGIYLITVARPDNLPFYYVGQSQDIARRVAFHLRTLRNGKHMNIVTQRAYDKYGEGSFSFDILCECGLEEINELEQWFLDEMCASKRCMNISTDALAPHRGKPLSTAHRKKISDGGLGLKRSASTRKKIAAANTGECNSMYGRVGALNPKSRAVIGIAIHSGERIFYQSAQLAERDGFAQASISRCCNRKSPLHMGYLWRFADQLDESESCNIASTSG